MSLACTCRLSITRSSSPCSSPPEAPAPSVFDARSAAAAAAAVAVGSSSSSSSSVSESVSLSWEAAHSAVGRYCGSSASGLCSNSSECICSSSGCDRRSATIRRSACRDFMLPDCLASWARLA